MFKNFFQSYNFCIYQQIFRRNYSKINAKNQNTINRKNKIEKAPEQKNHNNSYNTVTSQLSFLSVDSSIIAFPSGEIEFIDGLQRLKRV